MGWYFSCWSTKNVTISLDSAFDGEKSNMKIECDLIWLKCLTLI